MRRTLLSSQRLKGAGMRRVGAVLAAALFWAGVAQANDPAPPAAATATAPPAAAPVQIPQSVWRPAAGRSAEHLQSGLLCPGDLDGFRLLPPHVYDGFGLDVSCGFNADHITLTVYVTRLLPDFEFARAYASAKAAIGTKNPQAHPTLLSDEQIDEGGLRMSRAVYSEDGGVRSDLWLTLLSPKWYLEYRATYPVDRAAVVSATLAKLTRTIEASAGRRLALCEKLAPPARAGTLVADPKTVEGQALMTSIIGGGVAIQAAKEKKTSVAQAITWCPEAPFHLGSISLLFWRGVMPDGSDARMDRVTGMTMGKPPELEISFDALANLIGQGKAKGAKPPERWTAATHDGPQTWIYGYFDGRPSPDTAAAFFADVLQGKTKAVGGYSTQGENITLNMPAGTKP